MALETTPFDVAELLDSPAAQADFLSAALASGDSAEIAHALGVVARARGMTAVANTAGLGRESLYKALRRSGNPELDTLVKVVNALGFRLVALPPEAPHA